VPARPRALAVALAVAMAVMLVAAGLALGGCASQPAAPVESTRDLGGGSKAASVAYDGLTLTLTAPASALVSAPVGVTVRLDNATGKPIDLGTALVGVRGFASAGVAGTPVAFEAGLDATSPPVLTIPAGGSKTVALTFRAPAQGSYTMRGVFGSAMRVRGNATPALKLTVR
jgi:hypothetical protein